ALALTSVTDTATAILSDSAAGSHGSTVAEDGRRRVGNARQGQGRVRGGVVARALRLGQGTCRVGDDRLDEHVPAGIDARRAGDRHLGRRARGDTGEVLGQGVVAAVGATVGGQRRGGEQLDVLSGEGGIDDGDGGVRVGGGAERPRLGRGNRLRGGERQVAGRGQGRALHVSALAPPPAL